MSDLIFKKLPIASKDEAATQDAYLDGLQQELAPLRQEPDLIPPRRVPSDLVQQFSPDE